MAEALRLAARGLWGTDPNPRVGCVIARETDHGAEIVGRGWHERAGGPHAEVVALRDAGDRARGASAWVTLEPCSHHGRTPPCAQALITAGITRVVCAVRDPHPAVDGGGIDALRQAGIEVVVGLMEAQARALNPGFFSRIERARPWVRAKLAGSLDGRAVGPDGRSQWITGQAARRDGHRFRARAGAILTGIGTVLADDPSMTVRVEGAWRQPVIVVVDANARLPASARLLATGAQVWQVTATDAPSSPPGVERIEIDRVADGGRLDLDALLAELARREINELHVEAGPTLTGALLAAGRVDELLLYQAPSLIGADGAALLCLPGVETLRQRLHLELIEQRRIGPDQRLRLRPGANSLKPLLD
ncbi:MAG: bifunctional diaminohydroxyphosphoribosylaminopyrimidine deaminase/5-amino-6-(5-phosphoribosylamino)uracil reductase RibD [Wenzhouxiangellaceae bacterium]|nr:bifunctional diaminohydroxyphosphoribosylaminopyrimidine deaminase/5-amino-6-(5-phosphoribosylamino)uracil reductase RibD [Wenzhouxiangellaceae bacterium]